MIKGTTANSKGKTKEHLIYLPENSSGGKKRRQSSKPDVPELPLLIVSYISCNKQKWILNELFSTKKQTVTVHMLARCIASSW